ALLLCEVGDFQAALKPLEVKLEAAPDDGWAHGMRGWALLHLGRDHGIAARKSYDRAHELEPAVVSWQLGQADALHLLREAAAQAAYQSIIDRVRKISAPDQVMLNALGWALYRLGEYKQASRVYTKLLSAPQAKIETQFALSLSLLAAGHDETSIVEYERAF